MLNAFSNISSPLFGSPHIFKTSPKYAKTSALVGGQSDGFFEIRHCVIVTARPRLNPPKTRKGDGRRAIECDAPLSKFVGPVQIVIETGPHMDPTTKMTEGQIAVGVGKIRVDLYRFFKAFYRLKKRLICVTVKVRSSLEEEIVRFHAVRRFTFGKRLIGWCQIDLQRLNDLGGDVVLE